MNDINLTWQSAIQEMPLIAILRGLLPEECIDIGNALLSAGFKIIEVPLNSPQPIETLQLLNQEFSDRAVFGAGTVLNAEQVDAVINTGCRLIVAPNLDQNVAQATNQNNGIYCPGVFTPTEAFAAVAAGASALKFFPAEVMPPKFIKALRAVLPASIPLVPVGGITPSSMSNYLKAGATGFGIGSALFKPGRSADAVYQSALEFVDAYKEAKISSTEDQT